MRRAVCAAIVVLVGFSAFPLPASAQVLSPGCQELNDPKYDGRYQGTFFDEPLQFFAGATITITATFASTATSIDVEFNVYTGPEAFSERARIGGGGVPSHTFSFAFPSDMAVELEWFAISFFDPLWEVSCAAAAPLAVSAPQVATGGAVAAAAVESTGHRTAPAGLLVFAAGAVLVQIAIALAVRRRRVAPSRGDRVG